MPFLNTIKSSMGAGVVGSRANMEEWNTITRSAEGTIGFGQPVEYSGGDGKVEKYFNSEKNTHSFVGLAEADVTLSDEAYVDGAIIPVMDMGVMWVQAGGVCTLGAEVKWDPETGKYSDEAKNYIPNARFDSSASNDGELVKVRLRKS